MSRIQVKPLALLPVMFVAQAFAAESMMDPVVITATRQVSRISESMADVSVIEREEIERAAGSSFVELLARQPGLQIVNNGGMGKTSSIFIRGAEARHTLLLVDGVPMGSATAGTPSLSDLPLSQIERIEIVRGPASAVYGSDAIGGGIQVFTRRGEGPVRFDASAGLGSNNLQETAIGVSGGSELFSGSLRISHTQTNGFNVAADPVRYQQANFSLPSPDRDGYRSDSVSGSFSVRPAKGHELGLTAYQVDGKNFYDGGGVTVNAYANVRNSVYTLYSKNQLTDAWTSLIRYGRSVDTSSNYAPGYSLFETQQDQWTWENHLRLPVGTLVAGYEHSRQEVSGTTQYTVRERTVSAPFIGYQASLGGHSLQLNARHDDNSQFGGKRTGNGAYGYRFDKNWSAHAAVGTAFKAPTFNQLYFPNFGTATLKPEQALNREIGLTWKNTQHRFGLVYFDNKITDLIGGSPLVNINQARIKGQSLTHQWTSGAWSVASALDFQKPRDAATGLVLPRRADESATFSATYATKQYVLGAEVQAVGRRYDNATNTRPLAGYGLVNFFGSYQLSDEWKLEGRVNNLLDKQYETAWSYAQPQLNAFVGIRYSPK